MVSAYVKSLAVLAILGGVIAPGSGFSEPRQYGYSGSLYPNSDKITEPVLLSRLDKEGRTLYISLDPEGKALALELANRTPYGRQGGITPRQAVEMAQKYRSDQAIKRNQERLRNGMDRLVNEPD